MGYKSNIYYVVNVYSSCDLTKKRLLWRNLFELKDTFKDEEWIIGGDFNAIKDHRERNGRVEVVSNNELKAFEEFIEESLLVDILCKGEKILLV